MRSPVAVENRPGASGVIGNELAARSPANGHTLLFATSATHVIAAYTMERLPYVHLKRGLTLREPRRSVALLV